ncbi:MAG: YbjN domain-containing protein [Thermoguttaceae bacterium]|nr:YbjN domain-containing protein [Thermoguttaceae bacterium]MDW8080037.1 hypothetical protein [Thermoguttaceae bacterium]
MNVIRLLFPQPTDIVAQTLAKRSWRFLRVSDTMIITGAVIPPSRCLIVFTDDQKRKTLCIFFFDLDTAREDTGPIGQGFLQANFKVHENEGHTQEQVNKVCERLMAENFRILLGRFERDPEDGEIRFSIALPYRNRRPTVAQIDWCINMGLETVTRVMPQIRHLVERSW